MRARETYRKWKKRIGSSWQISMKWWDSHGILRNFRIGKVKDKGPKWKIDKNIYSIRKILITNLKGNDWVKTHVRKDLWRWLRGLKKEWKIKHLIFVGVIDGGDEGTVGWPVSALVVNEEVSSNFACFPCKLTQLLEIKLI